MIISSHSRLSPLSLISTQMFRIKYRQKMKKIKECFHEAFIRHVEAKGKVFSTDEIKFSFSDCKFRRISPWRFSSKPHFSFLNWNHLKSSKYTNNNNKTAPLLLIYLSRIFSSQLAEKINFNLDAKLIYCKLENVTRV